MLAPSGHSPSRSPRARRPLTRTVGKGYKVSVNTESAAGPPQEWPLGPAIGSPYAPFPPHLPVFPFAGNSPLNRKTRVRFWVHPPGNQNRSIRRCHVVDLAQDITKRAATAHDPTELKALSTSSFKDALCDSSCCRSRSSSEERARICGRRRGLVRKHLQPAEFLLVDQCPGGNTPSTPSVSPRNTSG